jgi:hypothetical protein
MTSCTTYPASYYPAYKQFFYFNFKVFAVIFLTEISQLKLAASVDYSSKLRVMLREGNVHT